MSIVVFALVLGFLMRDRLGELAGIGVHGRQDVASASAADAQAATRLIDSPPNQSDAAGDNDPHGGTLAHVASAPGIHPAAEAGVQTEAQSSEPDTGATETPPQTVPVTLSFRQGEGPNPQEARLQNLTNAPLAVSITATDVASRSQSIAQVTIPPHRRADLLAAGLSIHSGDEVKITSPQYSDLTFTAQ